jgi:hypothetical protein
MRTLVVYESMYGNTHLIAEAVARGLRPAGSVEVASVADARYEAVGRYDLLVVGGPTHAHGMSRTETRQSAVAAAQRAPDHLPHLEPDAGSMGLRAWLDLLGLCDGPAAAFDTRRPGHPLLTGHASKGIAGMLREHGFHLVAEPVSFLVDGHEHLLAGEEEQAEQWGSGLAATMTSRLEH